MSKPSRMTSRLLWLMVLATTTSACLGVRGAPRFGAMRTDSRPLEFRHDIRLYTVDNGMTVVLLPDRRTNLVTVDARYLVGAADDPAGRAGLAHLVEHLTFEARTDKNRASIKDLLGEAALYNNAFTSHDVTHYTATALAHRLQDVLELEAQRLEMNCELLDDAVFRRERDVVLEESAERRTPWSDLNLDVMRTVWGEHHPYARGLGTREVSNATRDEVCGFLGNHYAPDRLMLVVTGDFDPDQAAQVIAKRFAQDTWKSNARRAPVQEARLTGTRSRHRADVEDAVAMVFFPAPPWGGDDAVLHMLALNQFRRVMGAAAEEEDWITGVDVSTAGAGQARLIRVMLSVDDPKRLDAAVDEVFERAPTMFEEVHPYVAARLLGKLQTGYVATYESFEDRGAWLGDYLTYTRHDRFMVPELEVLSRTSMVDADRYARERFVRNKSHVALVEPSGKPATATPATVASDREPDLASWRAPVDAKEAQQPLPAPTSRGHGTVEEQLLDNGLRVLLAPDPTSALVDVRLVFPYGDAADPSERRGRAVAAASLLEPDPNHLYATGDSLLIGWGLSTGTQLDIDVSETSTVFVARGASNLADWHVWRLSWLIDQCVYSSNTVTAFRDGAVRASSKDADPAGVLGLQLLFGAGHPYATPPPTGEAWSWLTRDELERYRLTHYVPRGATLLVTGGFDAAAMRKHVQTLFGPWSDAPSERPVPLPAAQPEWGPSWVGTRDAARTQVGLEVAFATASDPDRNLAARRVLSEMVRDRLRIVREGMGASYGVQVSYAAGTGGGAFYIESELAPARAAKAASAIVSEIEALRTGAGTMAEDFVRARRRALATAMADTADVSARADRLEYSVRKGLPIDHLDQVALAISKVTPAEVAAVAAADLDARHRVVSVSAPGDRLDEVLTALKATETRIFDK